MENRHRREVMAKDKHSPQEEVGSHWAVAPWLPRIEVYNH